MSLRIVTGEVRLCWPKLFEPVKIGESGDPKYSVMLLISKKDTATIEKLRQAEAQAEVEQKSKWMGKSQNKPSIIKDGDDGSAEDYPERKGHYYMSVSASAEYRPGVVDAKLQEILDPSEVYSGVYAKVSLTAFAYNFQGNRGLSFGLNNVQVLGKGDSLAGGVKATDEFEVEESEALI